MATAAKTEVETHEHETEICKQCRSISNNVDPDKAFHTDLQGFPSSL